MPEPKRTISTVTEMISSSNYINISSTLNWGQIQSFVFNYKYKCSSKHKLILNANTDTLYSNVFEIQIKIVLNAFKYIFNISLSIILTLVLYTNHYPCLKLKKC